MVTLDGIIEECELFMKTETDRQQESPVIVTGHQYWLAERLAFLAREIKELKDRVPDPRKYVFDCRERVITQKELNEK